MTRALSVRAGHNLYENVLCEELVTEARALCALLPAEQISLLDESGIAKLICKDYAEEWNEARQKKYILKGIWDKVKDDKSISSEAKKETQAAFYDAKAEYDDAVKKLRMAYRDVKDMVSAAANVYAKMRETITQSTLSIFLNNVMAVCEERFGDQPYFDTFEDDLRSAVSIDGEFQSAIEPQFAEMMLSVPLVEQVAES